MQHMTPAQLSSLFPSQHRVGDPKALIIHLTPGLATRWLESSDKNRSIHRNHLLRLKQTLRTLPWPINGETIIFDTHGHMIDGHHRCTAVVETGVAIDTYVIYDIDPAARKTINTGLRWQPGDFLTFDGEINANILGTALRWLWRYEQSYMEYLPPGINPTPQELMTLLDKHPAIRSSVTFGKGVQRLMSGGLATALHYLFSRHHPILAKEFFTLLKTREGLTSDRTLYFLGRRLDDNARNRSKLPQNYIAAITIKAWNAETTGRHLKVLRWNINPEINEPEPFPKIL